jgi:LPPG:FO 2-phospho-L-lactate transferase
MVGVKVTVLSGGVGGARFLLGLRELGHDLTVIGNVGDDVTMLGLRICPDLDTVVYTLSNAISTERGWGREGETWRVRDEVTAYEAAVGAGLPTWFGLGDLDLATHLVRSQWLREAVTLSEVVRRLCARWPIGVTLLPASDDPVETWVRLADGRRVHFQEWWVRLRAAVPAVGFDHDGGETATAAPGVLAAIESADVVVLPPSNPVVSIGAILAVPGIAEALRQGPAPVVGLSPIVGGAPLRGMADACLSAIGVPTTAAAVALHYGARSGGGLLDCWLVDTADAGDVATVEAAGISCLSLPLLMDSLAATVAMATAAVNLAPANP